MFHQPDQGKKTLRTFWAFISDTTNGDKEIGEDLAKKNCSLIKHVEEIYMVLAKRTFSECSEMFKIVRDCKPPLKLMIPISISVMVYLSGTVYPISGQSS